MQVKLNVSEVYEKHTREHSTASEKVQTVNGWKISEKQCELITLGDRSAVDAFFKENFDRLKICARAFVNSMYTGYNGGLVEVGDLINQVYVDMRRGFLVMDVQHVSNIVYHSFRYASVGGFGDELGAYVYKPVKRIEAVM